MRRALPWLLAFAALLMLVITTRYHVEDCTDTPVANPEALLVRPLSGCYVLDRWTGRVAFREG